MGNDNLALLIPQAGRSKTSSPSGSVTQGCLLRVHMCLVGRSQDVSSPLPLVSPQQLRGKAITVELILAVGRCARYLSQQTGAARFFGMLLARDKNMS